MNKEENIGYILNSKVSALTFDETINKIENTIHLKQRSYVCIANTHSLVTATNNNKFYRALNNADIVTPDGMPLVWALKKVGFKKQNRVDGPKLMEKLCDIAATKQYKVFLYGSTEDTLNQLEDKLLERYKTIKIVGKISPPFREVTEQENNDMITAINQSKADLVFVGLGCPKQEIWMAENSNKINSILLGVGAAFDFIAGKQKRPHYIIQSIGLEWLYRLISEPKRLWKRYLYNNPIYIYQYFKTYRKDKKRTLDM